MQSRLKEKQGVSTRTNREKERVFKGLTQVLASLGFKVRREELKRGPGWAASSGTCRKMEEKLVFVDKRTALDEQIAFLVQTFSKIGQKIEEENLTELPEELRAEIKTILTF